MRTRDSSDSYSSRLAVAVLTIAGMCLALDGCSTDTEVATVPPPIAGSRTGRLVQAELPDHVALSLRREYGKAIYTQCRLDIVISGGQGLASLLCALNMP